MDLRATLLQVLAEVSETHLEARLPDTMTDEISLVNELGFDSVAYVAVISTLEDKLGFIPTPILEEAAFPTTFGELVMVYEREMNDNEFSSTRGDINEGLRSTAVIQRG